ncbi:NAD(P)-binding protein [Pholiota conissans]|uniref:NAD(P)-binding protein n=1 Tax=Pholiota conissans TaxID=109636 RepID=A0A9P6CS39_9AGAR|nr:NAD(P)-binding protein [Pholiota conissans]
MTILVTGGRGKTGIALSKLLHDANLPFLIASRSGQATAPYKAVIFDWADPTTYENPFKADPNIDRIYVVGPEGIYDALPAVKPFIDFARTKGVKRFVLLGASRLGAGDSFLGAVHQYLIDIGVEYAVLRPTWFYQNFSTTLLSSIRDSNQTFSATGEGRMAFVSTEDIAQVALEALTAEPSLNKDILIFGPELFSHDEVAKLFSSILGREITHKKITTEALEKIFAGFGVTQQYAEGYANLEKEVSLGLEEKLFNSTNHQKFIGKRTLEEYIKANRDLWIKQ